MTPGPRRIWLIQTPAARSRGLTLVELLVTMSILLVLAGMMFWMVKEVVRQWTTYERQRMIYDRASFALDRMADDIGFIQAGDPPNSTEIKSYVIGYYDAETGQNQLRMTRSFESGPERAIINSDLHPLQPGADPNAGGGVGPGAGSFTGLRSGNFGPLGGMAMVDYFVEDRVLYRGVFAPVPGIPPAMTAAGTNEFKKWLRPAAQIPLSEDVLYLSFDYWSQFTQSWQYTAPNSKTRGPEKVWDSTRCMSAGPLSKFVLHSVGPLLDSDSHVFPQKIRITITVDAPMPRCVNTKTIDEVNEYDGMIFVDSTQGFPAGGTEDSYILLEDEWIHYKKKNEDGFVCDERGARGSIQKSHVAGSTIRTGKTFCRVVNIPCYREDERVWMKQ